MSAKIIFTTTTEKVALKFCVSNSVKILLEKKIKKLGPHHQK